MNQTKKVYQNVKGTRNFYPEDWAFQQWLSQQWLSVGRLFGFQEYESSMLEPIELYLEKSSVEIVKEQTFSLQDRSGETLVLRPELTPSLAKMVAAKENELSFPVRWQSYGRFWRYEKPQKGRGREFFQWNIDCLGVDSPESDAEMISIACYALKNLNLTPNEVQIKVNNRFDLENLLIKKLSIDSKQVKTILRAIDKIDKLSPTEFNTWLLELGLNNNQINILLETLKTTSPDFSERLTQLLNLIPNDIKDYVQIDLKIVRGFEYYTGLVFEAWANTSELKRSIFGGGRYDNLTQQVGGQKVIPGVGFAIGDMPIFELLNITNKLPLLNPNSSQILIATFSSELYNYSNDLANFLRSKNINCLLNNDPSLKLSNQFKFANRNNIKYVVVIGPDEIKQNTIMLKNMTSGEQKLVDRNELINIVSML